MRSTTWILAALACAACGGTTPAPAPASTDAGTAASAPQPPAPDYLPEEAGGWTRADAVQRFGPGNLWEYIDGAAEHYLAFGFEQAETVHYVQAGHARATVDVYRMTESVGAYGIYTEERSPKAAPVAVGAQGQVGTDALRFWAGNSYVKLSAFPADSQTPADLERLAREIATRLGDAGSPPVEVTCFPPEGLIEGSVKYVPGDVLGQAFLSRAFQAEYRTDRGTMTLVLLAVATPDLAKDALGQYAAFFGSAGVSAASPGIGDESWSATDGFYGRVLAVRAGRHLAIVLGAPDARAARALVSAALARLPASSSQEAGRP